MRTTLESRYYEDIDTKKRKRFSEEEMTNAIKKHIQEDGKIKAIDLYIELFKGETQ